MTPEQMRMARAALGITVREIEARTGVNKNTVSRYEAGRDVLSSALQKLEKLFRDEGIIFVDEDALGGQGVRLPIHGADSRSRAGPRKLISGKRSQKTK
jgi:transcriptional regulator with XRE-family HTH domain